MATRLSVRAFTVISLLVFITAAAAEQPSPAPTGPQPVGTTVYSLHESGTLVSVTGGVSTGLVDFGGCSATCLDMARDASGNFVVARGSSLAILNPGGNLIRSIAAPEGANYFSVAVDSQGSYIVADTGTRRLLRIAPGPPNTSVSMGTWTLPEGSVSENAYVRIDRAGNYILMVDDQDVNDDPPSLRVFLRTASGPLTSLAITGDAQPISTGGLTFDANGNYVDIDWWGHTVFTITPAGAATVLYSNPNGYLLSPRGITRDPASGDFFLADDDLDAIYTLTPNGLVLNVIAQFGALGIPGAVIVADTVPRNAIDYVLTDSDPAQIVPVGGGAPLSCSPCSGFPSDFAIDAKGNFIVASDGALVKITPGGGACPTGCTILTPVNGQNFFSVAIDGAGNYVVGDNFNHQILKVAPGSPGTITGAIPYTVNEFEGDAYEDVYVRIDAAGNYVVVEDNDEDNPVSIFVIPPGATSSPAPLTLTPGLPLTSIPTTFLGGMTLDATGRYVITDYNSGQVYVVSQAGAFNVLYNSGSTFDALLGIYLDPISGNFLLTDYFSGGLYTMDQAATQVTLVQSGLQNPVVCVQLSNGPYGHQFDNAPGGRGEPVLFGGAHGPRGIGKLHLAGDGFAQHVEHVASGRDQRDPDGHVQLGQHCCHGHRHIKPCDGDEDVLAHDRARRQYDDGDFLGQSLASRSTHNFYGYRNAFDRYGLDSDHRGNDELLQGLNFHHRLDSDGNLHRGQSVRWRARNHGRLCRRCKRPAQHLFGVDAERNSDNARRCNYLFRQSVGCGAERDSYRSHDALDSDRHGYVQGRINHSWNGEYQFRRDRNAGCSARLFVCRSFTDGVLLR